jgi:hypothetical protein
MTGTVTGVMGSSRYAGGRRRAMPPNSSTILEPCTGAHPGWGTGSRLSDRFSVIASINATSCKRQFDSEPWDNRQLA